MKIKKIFMSCLLLAGVLSASAQEQYPKTVYDHNPYWYIQVQGGAQYTLGEIDFLGQTNKLNDSVVAQLQTQATDFLKPGISYPAYQQGDTLFFIRMSYVCNNETLSHTFYADKQLEHIVAVK